ncbi:MAG: hypothetical protein WBD07_02605 [Vicinamibacterales bacterium]
MALATESDGVSGPSPRGRYIRFLGLAALVVTALMGIGFLPTRRLGGEAALPAMLVGCLISLTAALMAGWLLVAAGGKMPTERMQTAFLAMVVRLGVVVALGLAAALSGELARTPLLFWLATSYVVLLPLEVRLAIEP